MQFTVDDARDLARQAAASVRHPRMTKAVVEMARERRSIARAGRTVTPRPRVLTYHAVGMPEWGVNDCAPRRLRRHLAVARSEGYRFVDAAEAVAAAPSDRVLAVTFDDGLRSVATIAGPILAEAGVPWTMFVTTDWADGGDPYGRDIFMDWSEIGALAASGVRIGSHSKTHQDFGSLGREEAEADLAAAADRFRTETGSVPEDFAIPLGTSRNWNADAQAAALAVGHTRIYAQSEDLRTAGTIARSFVASVDDDRLFAAVLNGAFDGWEEP